jgi:hypothetical protein
VSANVPQHAHGHGHIDATGKGHHDSTHADASAPVSQIGNHFAPMVANAPVQALSVPHRKVFCAGCTAKTWWQPSMGMPACAHCGAELDAANAG